MRQSAENIKLVDENSAGIFQHVILPRPGRKFVFDVTPGASYASVGVEYTCGYGPDRNRISISRVEGNSGTEDSISAWQYAKWRYV